MLRTNHDQELLLPDGARLRLAAWGSGPPLVLIPGWACSIEVFTHNIPAFAKQRRVIAYDPRSQGLSSQTEDGNNYRQRGRDLNQVIEDLTLDSVALLGWSLGVYDILSYLEQFGLERVSSLVLIDESPKIIKAFEGDWGEGMQEEIDGLISLVAGGGYLTFFRDYMAQGFQGDMPSEFLDRMTELASRLSPPRAAALLEDATKYDFTDIGRQAAEQLPVLQIVREDWAREAIGWIRQNQPNAQVEVLGGHLMLIEHAKRLNEMVLSFLVGNSYSQSMR